MNKARYWLMACACLAWPACSYAQDIEKEFEEFAKQQQQAFDDFKNKADAEFETFLRQTWEEYNAFAPIPVPTRPEPVNPVEFEKDRPQLPPVEIKPGKLKVPESPVPGMPESTGPDVRKPDLPDMADMPAPGIYIPGLPYTPIQIPTPTVQPGRAVFRTEVDFYGTSFLVDLDAVEDLELKGNKEGNVADAWKAVCKQPYEQLLKDCLTLKKEKRLSDWAYLLLTKRIGMQLYGAERPNEVVFLQMFLLSKSGYKVKLAKIDNQLKLMVATAGTIYSTPYLSIDGDKYYVFEPDPDSSLQIYTYKRNFAEAKNLVSLSLSQVPAFDEQALTRTLTPSTKAVTVQTTVNRNLIDFYRDYPQCDVALHYHTPMSERLRGSLYPALKQAIEGKSQKDAANLLLNFVQTAFEYQTDGDQFGYEKPFFPDETFFYPYCDCEDRAMLYATLVKDLLGLKAILLDYPNHIAAAVCFDEDIPGDYVVLGDGTRYLVCDPTYIGAPIGVCMDQYKGVSPEVIR